MYIMWNGKISRLEGARLPDGAREATDLEVANHLESLKPTIFSKLKIRRAMRSLNIEAKLDALLGASPTFAADWADAQDIDLADPVLSAALAAGSVNADEIAAIKTACQA